jgi:hypothetical protein
MRLVAMWLVRVAVGCVALAIGPGATKAAELRPGMALAPGQLTPDAARYEALLQAEDTDAVRRQFDDRRLYVGGSFGWVSASPAVSLLFELNVHDRLAVGTEVGLTISGPAGGAYVRGRPLVWGGRGRGPLHALTLQTKYDYRAHGGDLSFCSISDCSEPRFVAMPVHFLMIDGGFEHAFARGFTLRYAAGVGLQLGQPAWRCRIGRLPAACGDKRPPSDTLFVTYVVLSHALL